LRRRLRASLPSVACAIAGSALAQQGGEILGVDPAAVGRGGVDLGIAESALSIGTNPAGIAFLPRGQVDGALRLFFSRLDFDPAQGPTEHSVDRIDLAPYFGIAFPEALGPVSFGLAVYPEQGFRSKIRMQVEAQAGPGGVPPVERLPVEVEFATIAVAPAAAFRISDTLAVGLSPVLGSTFLSIDGFAEQPVTLFQGEVFPGITFGDFLAMSGFETFQSDYSLDARSGPTVAGRIGILWKPWPGWSFGATYRTASTEARLRGNVTVDMESQFGDPGFDPFFPDGRRAHYDVRVKGFRTPRSIGAGVAWEPAPRWRLAAEGRWTEWSEALDELRFELDDGDNPGFNTVIGSDGFEIDFPLHWRDSWSGAVGVEHAIADRWTVRAGFAANENPVPSSTTTVFAPAFTRWHATAGATYDTGSVAWHLAYVHSFREEVRVGRSDVAQDFEGSTIGFAVDSVVVGVSIRF